MLKLYGYFRSSATFRVRVALHLKKLEFVEIPIHLLKEGGEQHKQEYKQINPQSLVPALEVDGKILTQSLAILDYLEEVYPQYPLLPPDPWQKAHLKSLALLIATDIHPLNNLRVLQYLTNTLNVNEAQKNAWYQHWITQGFTALESWLVQDKPKEKFCHGDQPGLVDACLAPQVYNAHRYNCDMIAYPTINRIFENCKQHADFIKAWPDNVEANQKIAS